MDLSAHNNYSIKASMTGSASGQSKTRFTDDANAPDYGAQGGPKKPEARRFADVSPDGASPQRTGKAQRRSGTEADRKTENKYLDPENRKSEPEKRELDNVRRIQYEFSRGHAAEETPQAKPDMQKRQFNEKLKKWVEIEYSQFVKYPDAHTTKNNLGDVLQTLKDRLKPSGKRDRSDSEGAGEKAKGRYNRFNLFNIVQAVKTFMASDDTAAAQQPELALTDMTL